MSVIQIYITNNFSEYVYDYQLKEVNLNRLAEGGVQVDPLGTAATEMKEVRADGNFSRKP